MRYAGQVLPSCVVRCNFLIDQNASIGIDWGVYGIPETFIVSNSVIKYRLIGPITEKNYKDFYLKIIEN